LAADWKEKPSFSIWRAYYKRRHLNEVPS